MTIVKSTYMIADHPFIAIDPAVSALIQRAGDRLAAQKGYKYFGEAVSLKLLECYCDITGQRVTLETVRTGDIDRIMWDFATVMSGSALVEGNERDNRTHTRRLFQAYAEARNEAHDLFPVAWDFDRYAGLKLEEANAPIATADQLLYWAGWPVTTDKGKFVYLRLAQVFQSHGAVFTATIYKEVKRYYTNRNGSLMGHWSQMFDYLASNSAEYPAEHFSTELGVKKFMNTYTFHYFSEAKKAEKDPQSQIKNWNRFVGGLEKCLCETKAWAPLSSPIRRPPPSTKSSSQTKTRELEDGALVQEKLLTTIPLTVTDSEAMELLFFHIKNDLSIVRKWATHEAKDLKNRQARRSELAAQGSPITDFGGKGFKLRHTMADICATLEDPASSVPIRSLRQIYAHLTGKPCSALDLATAFGFPTAGSLMAHQTLLVLEHPEITTEALVDHELYNEDGAMTGFSAELKTLTLYKKRKDAEVREQVIALNDYSLSLVQQIIDITTILRTAQKKAGEDNYRYLFLTSGNAFLPISQASVTVWSDTTFKNNAGQREVILSQFLPHCDLEKIELEKFIKKVRLTRIRTSRAVEIYLKSRNPEDMSKALGHEHYYPELLSHYLPDCILGFIKARWIRIFQKNLVCEAMKDSPYLLRATRFTTMEELHSFLENHSFSMPAQATDPERLADQPKTDNPEAVVSVSEPFLVSLLSLEEAVNEATEKESLCGRALYWSVFAAKLKASISSGFDRTLKKQLENALKLVDPKRMEALIYA